MLACAVLLAPPIAPSRAAAATLASQEGAWDPIVVTSRMRHGAVLDPLRDRMLVFGGDTGAGLMNTVVAMPLSGTPAWSPLAVTGSAPLARRGAGVVYDPVRDRLLVFGGNDGTSPLNDLWALSLAGTPHWTFLGSAGTLVPPREEHVTVYDAAHDRLVVYGGLDTGKHALSDCWAYSLAGPGAWTALGTGGAGPLARQGACGIYDPVRERLLVFGGADSSGTAFSDTWALPLGAGGTWGLLPLASGEPVGRYRSAAAYDASRDQMVVYGGFGSGILQVSVLTLSLAGTATWNILSSSTAFPAGRDWVAMIVDPARDRLVVYGGSLPARTNDLFAFALGGTHPWTTLTPPSPRLLRGTAFVFDPVRNRMLQFGGIDGSNNAYNELWSLDTNGPAVWTRLTPSGTQPQPRGYMSAVYDAARDRILVYGGATFIPFQVYADVWALSLAGTPTWQPLSPTGTPPSARYLYSAILDPVRDRMVVFGGTGGSTMNNDLWTLSLGGTPAWTFQPMDDPIIPVGRSTQGAIYDPVRDRMIVNGGTDFSSHVFQETWELPLAGALHWHLLPLNNPLPAARYLATYAYDPGRNRMLVYGGVDLAGHLWTDAWALQLGATDQWLALQPAGTTPFAHAGASGAFDPAHDRFVFAGATSSDVLSIDWNVSLTSAPPASPLEVALSPPFPNPMRDAVSIRFVTADPGPVRIAIHDVSGRHIRTLEDEPREPGAGLLRWDGRDDRGTRVAPGVYLVQMRSRGQALSRRIVLTE
jgi:hypothetical protein